MAFEGLVTELKRLIKDRVPGSQAKESIESFGTTKFLLEFDEKKAKQSRNKTVKERGDHPV